MSPPPEGFGGANLTRQVGTAKKASDTRTREYAGLRFSYIALRR